MAVFFVWLLRDRQKNAIPYSVGLASKHRRVIENDFLLHPKWSQEIWGAQVAFVHLRKRIRNEFFSQFNAALSFTTLGKSFINMYQPFQVNIERSRCNCIHGLWPLFTAGHIKFSIATRAINVFGDAHIRRTAFFHCEIENSRNANRRRNHRRNPRCLDSLYRGLCAFALESTLATCYQLKFALTISIRCVYMHSEKFRFLCSTRR